MKQKGFTLIELLAVIVILAIIALIAVPVILNVIEKSKIGAAEQSAQGYVDAVEKQIVTNKVKNENLIEEGEYTKAELDEKNVKIKGEITDAIVVVGAKGRVTQGRFCINGYSIDYDGKKATKNSEADYCNEMNSIVEICSYEINQVFNFEYTGDIQEFTPDCSGKYKLEAWGAQGGTSYSSNYSGGKGAYSSGTFTLNKNEMIRVLVGQQGYIGGSGGNWRAGGGGGGTFIVNGTTNANSTALLIAGGGGGSSGYESSFDGYYAGHIVYTSESEEIQSKSSGNGGSSGAGFSMNGTAYNDYYASSFKSGGTGALNNGYGGHIGGGGYGGGGAGGGNPGGGGGGFSGGSSGAYSGGRNNTNSYNFCGDGGTSFNIGLDQNNKTGNQQFLSPSGSNETGHTGNGYARITYLGK